MATECMQDSLNFGTVEGRAVVGAFDGGVISSDSGALLLGATERAIKLVSRFGACSGGTVSQVKEFQGNYLRLCPATRIIIDSTQARRRQVRKRHNEQIKI